VALLAVAAVWVWDGAHVAGFIKGYEAAVADQAATAAELAGAPDGGLR
jgi:hypothetical protein